MFFPRLRQGLDELPDRRSPKRIHYPARFPFDKLRAGLVWEAVLMFVLFRGRRTLPMED